MDSEIKALQEQIIKLKKEAEGVRSMELTDMPKGGQARDTGDVVADYVELQKKCAAYMAELVSEKDEAMNSIMKIELSELRTVLILRYLQCLEWDDIASRMGYSLRTVFSIHGDALNEFEKVRSKFH